MLPAETASAFFLVSVLLALSPGPDNLFVLTQSAMAGPRAGLAVTGGLCTGLVVHTSAVALGVAVLFRTSAIAFAALKFAGAAYLLYLAWLAFTAGRREKATNSRPPAEFRRLYLRGIIMNVTNPKVSIFFLAFLPQFADPARGALVPQIMLLGALFAVATVLVFGSIALFAGSIGDWLVRSGTAQRLINMAAGTVFIGLAVRLLATER
ncbi:MAG: LysE family translocator [Woeseiaceae bacterium]|nr:LysE family translocator [Woeseiaceae bacterium]